MKYERLRARYWAFMDIADRVERNIDVGEHYVLGYDDVRKETIKALQSMRNRLTQLINDLSKTE